MKSELAGLKWVAALAVVAGCATENEKNPRCCAPEAPRANAVSMALPKVETLDEALKRHQQAVDKWSCHSFPDEILAGVPAAMKFIAENAEREPSHAEQFRKLRKSILRTLDRGRDFETGIPCAKAIYDNEALGYDRCAAARYLAMGLVDKQKDYAAADRLYVDLLEPARRDPRAQSTVVAMIRERAYLHTLRCDQAGALKYIESERAKTTGDAKQKKQMDLALDDMAYDVFDAFYDYRGSVAYFTTRGNKAKLFDLYDHGFVSDLPAMAKLSHEIILDDACDARLRTRAWFWLYSRDGMFCEANLARCFDGKKGSTNEFLKAMTRVMKGGNLYESYGALTPPYNRNPELSVKYWEIYLKTAKAAKAPVEFSVVQYAVLAYAELGDKAKAIAAADEGLANSGIRPEERFALALMRKTLTFAGTESEIAAQAKAAAAELGKGLTPKAYKENLQRGFSVVTVCPDDTLARGVSKYYLDEVRATLPKKIYTVRFSDRNITGVGDWENLPFKPEESDFDRSYGGRISFLETDVATGDRGNAVQGGEKARQHPTTLQVVADTWGIHFVCTFYDRRARQFESGELDCGSYESYIAPGENKPYACFLSYPRNSTRGGVMNTSYDRPGHRRINDADPTKFRSDTAFTDDSVITYTAFSWDNFADYVPASGAEWDFESIFWGPVPSAWNGTASIHGRSTWGKLRFELDDAARVKIWRSQLFKAVSAYRAEKLPRPISRDSVQEGVFSHWSDDELGDVAFYEKCLVPLMAELDPIAERVKAGMSDADVKSIAGTYLSRFRDIRFEVARLRTRYLDAKLMDE